MNKQTVTFYKLQKENAELRKRVRELEESLMQRKQRVKQINVKNSHNSFYMSKAWRELRYKVLMKHKLNYGSVCLLCKETTTKLHVDHIEPRSKRPDLELSITNLQVLCGDCNIGKLNKDSVDWSKLQEKFE